MVTARAVKIGVGLRDKRARILRALDAHVRYLTLAETMAAWTPPERAERPARPPDPDPYRARPASHFYTPRERPELQYPAPGADALSDAEVAAWVAGDEFVRSGLSPKTARACAYLATFAPNARPPVERASILEGGPG